MTRTPAVETGRLEWQRIEAALDEAKNEESFTPGPWRVVPGDSVVFVRSESAAGDRDRDIVVTNRKKYFERHDETDLANARLIAAAPEMLAALEACAKFFGWEDEDDGDYTPVRMARAAITKATGAS